MPCGSGWSARVPCRIHERTMRAGASNPRHASPQREPAGAHAAPPGVLAMLRRTWRRVWRGVPAEPGDEVLEQLGALRRAGPVGSGGPGAIATGMPLHRLGCLRRLGVHGTERLAHVRGVQRRFGGAVRELGLMTGSGQAALSTHQRWMEEHMLMEGLSGLGGELRGALPPDGSGHLGRIVQHLSLLGSLRSLARISRNAGPARMSVRSSAGGLFCHLRMEPHASACGPWRGRYGVSTRSLAIMDLTPPHA